MPDSILTQGSPITGGERVADAPLSWLRGFALSLRLLLRDRRAGELRVLTIGLIIAVASLTTVSFFTHRVRQALSQEAGQLLGADLVLISDRPIGSLWEQEAHSRGLHTMRTVRFPSMTVHGEKTQLTEIKAVSPGYPLKGRLAIDDGKRVVNHPGIPASGTAWADERLLARLGVNIGERIAVGSRELEMTARLSEDPETSISFLTLGPRLVMNMADLESTGLIQPGSRLTYRLGFAGPIEIVREFRERLQGQLQPGQRMEDVRDARPEVRSALERAEKFLGLSALLSVVLAAAAIAL